jgi:hypothetical protein
MKVFMLQGQLMKERKNICCMFSVFVITYVARSLAFMTYGHTWVLICEQWIRWFFWDILAAFWDLPPILSIVYLHYKNFSPNKRRTSTLVSVDKEEGFVFRDNDE